MVIYPHHLKMKKPPDQLPMLTKAALNNPDLFFPVKPSIPSGSFDHK